MPGLSNEPDTVTFLELNSDTETSTCGLFKTFDNLLVNSNLNSSTVEPSATITPAFG